MFTSFPWIWASLLVDLRVDLPRDLMDLMDLM
jgi:hypothetical protein